MHTDRTDSEMARKAEDGLRNLGKNLLAWYAQNKRILPWRDVADPYHVWLSEIMLQQTRVEAVKRYYKRFLSTLPTIASLALAEEDVYLKLWEGLGYYSRVRNLHKGALQVMQNFGGQMPCDYDDIISLSGIGSYTASAIASIAFGKKTPAIDGNLLRIFARLQQYGVDIKSNAAKKDAHAFFLNVMNDLEQEDLSEEMSVNPFGDLNQALMDLGSMICLPNGQPLCDACPIANCCKAGKAGNATDFPIVPKKKPRTIEEWTVFVIRDSGKIALSKRKSNGLLAGMYEFPNAKGHLTQENAIEAVKGFGFTPLRIKSLGESRHIFSHKEWYMIGYEVFCDEFEPQVLRENAADYENANLTLQKSKSNIFTADIHEIEAKYSIPSAFAAYRKACVIV